MKNLELIFGMAVMLAANAFAENTPAIIPAPQKMELRAGNFRVSNGTRIYVDSASRETGNFLAERLRKSTGFPFAIRAKYFSSAPVSNGILLTTKNADTNLGAEGYELIVTTNSIVIRAPAQAGLFYGVQTLLQLLPPEIFSSNRVNDVNWRVPCVAVEDQPRFKWRGMLLDVSRHFFNKNEIERLLDEMALHKLNTFHWHLVDDQGWRIEIKKYPKLTQIGAWRAASPLAKPQTNHLQAPWLATSAYGADGRYGGFYTQDDVREVVAYATARHITIIPEIEMPGHSVAALAAYPELSCTGGPFTTDVKAGVNHGIYCTGNDQTYEFLQDVLTEIFQLFPSKYIHIGGDEVPTDEWRRCPKDQAVIKREGLNDASQLESYFIRRMEKFINAHGHTLIGWSEIREGGLAQSAVVMDWIGGAVEAATNGHDVVMSPLSDCYLDHYQSEDKTSEPRAIGGYLPLKKIYAFDPIPENLPPQFASHILGAQGNLWTEYVESFPHVEYMAFPRLCALAEVTWSPKEKRDWDNFSSRLKVHTQRLDELGVNYRRVSENMAKAPAPFGAVPSARQLRWQEMEFVGFLHFTVNTFTDKEWGDGDEDEKIFNPTAFDADQIVRVARDAGMKELILTAKHHDGFCLWPSKFTEHSVKNSVWKSGNGDVVKEISDGCRKYNMKFGVYLSPWDRNQKTYAQPEYLAYYRDQLRELLTSYGPISEVWFDGANGGSGFYGGARENRTINNRVYYDWPATWQIVRELQPDACMFSDGGPDVRWVGNENGIAGNPCWVTLNAGEFGPGYGPINGGYNERLNSGDRAGTNWIPPECDVSIRPGWFYHASEDDKVKTPQQLLDLYYASVGRGGTLLLNIPPDRRGQIHENDIQSLREFRRILDATFAEDLATDAKITASNTRGGDSQFAPKNVVDFQRDTYWTTDDSVTTPELVLDLGKPVTLNVVRLREYLPLGQRIEAFALDQWKDGRWIEFASGASIGNCRLVRGAAITTDKVRVRITKAPVCPALSEVGLFLEKQ